MVKLKVFAALGAVVALIAIVVWLELGGSHAGPSLSSTGVLGDLGAGAESNAATIDAMKRAGPMAGSPLFEDAIEDLSPSKTTYTCAQANELRARAESPSSSVGVSAGADDVPTIGLFWESKSSPNAFIYYENETRLLVVCDGHGIASTILKDNGLSPREELVKFDQPGLSDWGHDGKSEFLIFRGQCVEGPCVGQYTIFQMAGSQLRQIAEINADHVDVAPATGGANSPTSLQVQASCYSMDWDQVFDYVAILDYSARGGLALVPPQQIRTRSIELLHRLDESGGMDADESETQKALGELQPLIYQAYQGKPLRDLKRVYATILSSIPDLRLGDPPPVQCDPMAILTMISEGR